MGNGLVAFSLAIFLWPAVAVGEASDSTLRVGLFGVVTGETELHLNGQKLPLDPKTPVINPLGLIRGQDVKAGDVLALTIEVSSERWTVLRAMQIFAVIGPATKKTTDQMAILGNDVLPLAGEKLTKGRWAAVSGFWQDNRIVDAHVTQVSATGFAHISGPIAPPQSIGNFEIGQTGLVRMKAKDPKEGQLWLVSGPALEAGIRADLMTQGLFSGRLDLVVMEGYASAPIASETYEVFGTGLIGYAKESDMPSPKTRAIFCGINGKVVRKTNTEMTPKLIALLRMFDCVD